MIRERIRGSLLGGAIGDALGYPVEFMDRNSILEKFGKNGLSEFCSFDKNGYAVISDDTQMTLFTANGLLYGITRWCTHGTLVGLSSYVKEAYIEWYQTQTETVDYQKQQICWIRDIQKLNVQRAPGNTCMSALKNPNATNNSKGCGGVMRVAPVAMLIAAEKSRGHNVWEENAVQKLAAQCAAITHKHPMGYISAAVFADILFQIFTSKDSITTGEFVWFVDNAMFHARHIFTSEEEYVECFKLNYLVKNVIRLNQSPISDHDAIRQLGEGWTGDEALSIAWFCTLRHISDFRAALSAAVNHDGDSDSTGAICGNLMGAIVGSDVFAFPNLQKLELKTLILEIADDMIKGCPISEYHSPSNEEEKRWEKRYVFGEDYITPFDRLFRRRRFYIELPKAVRMKKAYRLLKELDGNQDISVKCNKAYEMALAVFDNEDFSPVTKLHYGGVVNGQPDYYDSCKEYLPAYWWGCKDSRYSPQCNNQIFKLNVNCFNGKSPIIAVRDDCGCQKFDLALYAYQLRAGLEPFSDAGLHEKYPEWLFLKINMANADSEGFAVFTNKLEKEYTVEIAHLGSDGKLHRIYLLNY